MSIRQCAAFAALVCFALPSGASATSFRVLGAGLAKCSEWTTERAKASPSAVGFEGWVEGYLTAINEFVWPSHNVTGATSKDDVFVWLDGYCASHDSADLIDGVVALRDHLVALQTPPKP